MEDPLYKITELLGSNLALAADADAAGLADDLADHVLGLGGRRVRVLLPLPADGPLGDVVRPHVRRHAGRGLAETATKDSVSATHLQEGDWWKDRGCGCSSTKVNMLLCSLKVIFQWKIRRFDVIHFLTSHYWLLDVAVALLSLPLQTKHYSCERFAMYLVFSVFWYSILTRGRGRRRARWCGSRGTGATCRGRSAAPTSCGSPRGSCSRPRSSATNTLHSGSLGRSRNL